MTLELYEDSTIFLTDPKDVVKIWEYEGHVRFLARFVKCSDVIELSMQAEIALEIGKRLVDLAEKMIATDQD